MSFESIHGAIEVVAAPMSSSDLIGTDRVGSYRRILWVCEQSPETNGRCDGRIVPNLYNAPAHACGAAYDKGCELSRLSLFESGSIAVTEPLFDLG